ncbi:G-patch domain-containing protein [Histoplasma capsulatum H143]|uniref:G-patch domain-containing protein n=1 Tax=Ajellomyces capsulatus (strain H143) TaxID=544712 RepID=C6HL26_AJECH|nr:G-patch domain-containing protein [Histoplasma capsulatum H143]
MYCGAIAEAKSRVPSKSEIAAAEAARREAALSTSSLDPSNKGFQMMAKLGFKPGTALGKDRSSQYPSGVDEWNRRLTEPLNVVVKEDRGGIGMDSEKKRKIKEQAELEVKRVKAEEGDFRERVRREREEKRTETIFCAAAKVAERLDAEESEEEREKLMDAQDERGDSHKKKNAQKKPTSDSTPPSPPADSRSAKRQTKPNSQINILYRGLVRAREENLRSQQARRGLYDSLATRDLALIPNPENLPTYRDTDLDADDKLALGQTAEGEIVEVELDENEDEDEDGELREFNALSAQERLSRVVLYLREKYRYCFWSPRWIQPRRQHYDVSSSLLLDDIYGWYGTLDNRPG